MNHFSYSDQLLNGRLGVVFTANAHDYYAPSPRTIAAYTYASPTGPRDGPMDAWQRQLQLTDGGPSTKRQSYSLNLDYRLSDATTVYLRSQIGLSELDNRGRTFTVQTNTVEPGFTDTSMTARAVAGSQSMVNASFQNKTGQGTNFTLGAKYRRGPWRADYSASVSRSANKYRSLPEGIRSVTLSGNTNISYRLSGSRGDPTPTFEQLAGRDVWDINSYTRMTASDEELDGLDRIYGGTVNLRRDFSAPVPFYLQTGLRLRRQERQIHSGTRNYNFVGRDGIANTPDDAAVGALAGFRDEFFVRRPFSEYGFVPWPGIGSVTRFYREHPQAFTENLAQSFISFAQGRREAEEEVAAGYVMADVRLGKLGVLTGVRMERTDITATGAVDDVPAGQRVAAAGGDALAQAQARFARRNRQTNEYDNYLPNLQLRYHLTRNLLLRASFTETLGRPEFSEVFPGYSVDSTFNNGQGRITQNGTRLKPQTSQNLDASAELYFEPVGVISFGVFRKDISDYIASVTDVVGSGPNNGFDGLYEGYELRTKTNRGDARVSGFEFNYSQELSSLAAWLRGAAVFANYTYVKALGSFNGTQAALEGFHPRAANVGVSYRRDRLFGSVKYNWRGRAISSLSLNRYTDERGIIDVSFSYKVYRQHAVFVEVKNLFSEPTEQYIDIAGRNGRYFTVPAQINFGVKGHF